MTSFTRIVGHEIVLPSRDVVEPALAGPVEPLGPTHRYAIRWREQPLPAPSPSCPGGGLAVAGSQRWTRFGPERDAFGEELLRAVESRSPLGGVLVHLPRDLSEEAASLQLLDAARRCLAQEGPRIFLLVHRGGPGAAFTRALHREASDLVTRIVELPGADGESNGAPVDASPVLDEIDESGAFAEARYTAQGLRLVPEIAPAPASEADGFFPLEAGDVLLVTGVGRSLSGDLALRLARESGARLALLGPSHVESDPALASFLQRLENEAVEFQYQPVDLRAPAEVFDAITNMSRRLGPITGFLHGEPDHTALPIERLALADLATAVGSQLGGARNILAALHMERLRLFVSLGSLAGRLGLPGQAHNALATEGIALLTEGIAGVHPHCRCLALEWNAAVPGTQSDGGAGSPLGLARAYAALREALASEASPGAILVSDTRPDLQVSVTSQEAERLPESLRDVTQRLQEDASRWLGDTGARVGLERENGETATSGSLLTRVARSCAWRRKGVGPASGVTGLVEVSKSRIEDVTLALAARGPVGCDVRAVSAADEATWMQRLGEEAYRLAHDNAERLGEDFATVATHAWSALTALSKAGAGPAPALRAEASETCDPLTWVVTPNAFRVVTRSVRAGELDATLVCGLAVRSEPATATLPAQDG